MGLGVDNKFEKRNLELTKARKNGTWKASAHQEVD